MKTFKVVLTRAYIVEVEAQNENEAKDFSGFYLETQQIFQQKRRKEKINFVLEKLKWR